MIQSCKFFGTSLEIWINTNRGSHFWWFWCPSLRRMKQSRFLFCLSGHIFNLRYIAIVYQYDIKARKIPKWMGRSFMRELNIFCKTTFWESVTSKKISSNVRSSMRRPQNQISSTIFTNSIILFLFFGFYVWWLKVINNIILIPKFHAWFLRLRNCISSKTRGCNKNSSWQFRSFHYNSIQLLNYWGSYFIILTIMLTLNNKFYIIKGCGHIHSSIFCSFTNNCLKSFFPKYIFYEFFKFSRGKIHDVIKFFNCLKSQCLLMLNIQKASTSN